MRLLVDAQLPRRLARWLVAHGHDAIHTLDLPLGNATPDGDLCREADRRGRVLVTKDADFVASHVLVGTPQRLWLIGTGNLSNADLLALVEMTVARVEGLFEEFRFVELTRTHVVAHRAGDAPLA